MALSGTKANLSARSDNIRQYAILIGKNYNPRRLSVRMTTQSMVIRR
jgi:hypothetical protein